MDSLKRRDDTTIHFDYHTLTSAQRQIVRQNTGEIRERLRRSAQDIWEIGQRLVEVRSHLKHGQFEAWLRDEFGWSRRTAYNFMSVYETFQESANFAQIDIATSALYLLAAPSTPQTLREEVLKQAERGEKITHKDLHQRLKSEKYAKGNTTSNLHSTAPVESSRAETCPNLDNKSIDAATKAPEIVAVIPKASTQADIRLIQGSDIAQRLSHSSDGQMLPGWYYLDSQHLLFCGDTASPEFFARIPHASLILAITSDDWDHDWIVEKADSVLILREAALEEISLKQLISSFSKPEEVVVFPWLPDPKMLSVAHALNRKIYAGDPDPIRCAQALESAKLTVAARAN